jgi:small subunit ribosomal protein S1
MTESFAQLFEESLKTIETRPGSIVRGVVVAIDKDVVLVDAGLKSESAIPAEQFKNAAGELEIQVGDEVDVALDAVEDGFGETLLSREKAKRHEAWITLEKAYEEAETVVGVINGKVKGGFTVELNGIRAFLPGSLVDVRPVRDTLHLASRVLWGLVVWAPRWKPQRRWQKSTWRTTRCFKSLPGISKVRAWGWIFAASLKQGLRR